MEITYIGHACFKIKGKNNTILIDPYDPKMVGFRMPTQKADVVLISHDHGDHNFIEAVKDYEMFINTPGEYEINESFIYGYQTYHDEKQGKERGKNTIYQIEIDGFNLLHLGDLGHELPKEIIEKLPDIDVLMIPVGGFYTIDAKTATDVMSAIEPLITIPMHFKTSDMGSLGEKIDSLEKFLEEMGVGDKHKRQVSLELKSRSDLPGNFEVLVLDPQH